MQLLLDIFGAFLLYLVTIAVVEDIGRILRFNEQIRVEGELARQIAANPYPLIVWAVIGGLIYLGGIILPLIFAKRTKLNQKQFDIWVYGVLAVRMLALIAVFEFMSLHLSFIMRSPDFRLQSLMHLVLIAILVRFTQFRIRKAQPKSSGSMKITFMED